VNTSEGGESKGGIAYSGGNPSVDSDVPDQLSGATEPLKRFHNVRYTKSIDFSSVKF